MRRNPFITIVAITVLLFLFLPLLIVTITQAAVLLRQTADSVLSVALNVGFQSETHFGKAFKKQYGISPGQYRKNETADDDTRAFEPERSSENG